MTTIKDIAKLAGLSLSTVSVVLNGKGNEYRISAATQQRVFEAVKELDYRPNVAARRLRGDPESARLTVAVFWTSDFRAPMLVRFLRGLQSFVETSEKKIEILINTYKNDELHLVATQQSLSMFNAAIICNISEKDQRYLESESFNLPIVLYNRFSDGYCTVNIDDNRVGSLAADAFVSHGKKSVGIITSASVFSGMDRRISSFIEAAERGGMKLSGIYTNKNSIEGGYLAGQELLGEDKLPGCLFCASDAMGAGVMRALYKKGIAVPGDIEMICIGNGDRDMQENFITSLSVVNIPIEDMGVECIKLLMKVIDREVSPPHAVNIPVEYIARESCGPIG